MELSLRASKNASGLERAFARKALEAMGQKGAELFIEVGPALFSCRENETARWPLAGSTQMGSAAVFEDQRGFLIWILRFERMNPLDEPAPASLWGSLPNSALLTPQSQWGDPVGLGGLGRLSGYFGNLCELSDENLITAALADQERERIETMCACSGVGEKRLTRI